MNLYKSTMVNGKEKDNRVSSVMNSIMEILTKSMVTPIIFKDEKSVYYLSDNDTIKTIHIDDLKFHFNSPFRKSIIEQSEKDVIVIMIDYSYIFYLSVNFYDSIANCTDEQILLHVYIDLNRNFKISLNRKELVDRIESMLSENDVNINLKRCAKCNLIYEYEENNFIDGWKMHSTVCGKYNVI